jgi:Alpha amylase, catalytic domain
LIAVSAWPRKPFIYEINTWVWLDTLSRAYNNPITLENIPDEVLDEISSYHVDAIWLMGIWTRSYGARASALKYAHEYKSALPDLTNDDIPGSPYAVGSYQPDENFGGRHGLATFREQLRQRGMRLLLDFVPNHVALDHAWVRVHPDYMILGSAHDKEKHASNFFSARDATGKKLVVGHGRDPYFPGWVDTAQLNAFNPGLRQAALTTLLDIASQCDGVRCDMAMLLINDVFAHTWSGLVGKPPATEYWQEIIPQVKAAHPNFIFMAEVYWDMEARLHAQGFNFCYDKRLYDRIRDNKPGDIRAHLLAGLDYQNRLVRFIENHDEHRAAESLGIPRSHPAAVLICTLPGATLLHDGQFVGRKIRLPVQLGRLPKESLSDDLKTFYLHLLEETRHPVYQQGDWSLFDVAPGKDNGTYDNLIAYGWELDSKRRVIVINMSGTQSQAHIQMPSWGDVGQNNWRMRDVMNGDDYIRQGEEMGRIGLYVDLKPYQSHLFHMSRA